MTKRLSTWTLWIFAVPQSIAISQEGLPPQDQPFAVGASEMARLEAAIQPFVKMGRDSFPVAKERYLSGLPPQNQFFVTTDLVDSDSRMEQVFVFVDQIEDETITGRIASDIFFVSGFEYGDVVSFPEERVKDWTISRPDGTEEGNFVGRFMDHYRPGTLFPAIFGFSVSETGQAQGIGLALVTNGSGDPVNIDLPPGWIEAASEIIRESEWPPRTDSSEVYVPMIYDPDWPDEPRPVAR